MTIEADVLQFLYRNPHSFLHVEAKDAKGKKVRGPWSGAAAGSWGARAFSATR